MIGRPHTKRSRAARPVALLAAVLLAVGLAVPAAWGADPVVRAVLFYSPNCAHCHTVLDEVLPPLFAEHGGPAEVLFDDDQPTDGVAFYLITNGHLEVLAANVEVQDGSRLFYAATEAFGIGSQGVPRLIAGDEVMIGSSDIPRRFPEIISATLEAGNVLDWPAIPGIAEAVASTGAAVPTTTVPEPAITTTTNTTGTTNTTAPATETTEAASPPVAPGTTSTTVASDPRPAEEGGTVLPIRTSPSMWERFRQDPTGNSVSVIVLLLMVAALIGAAMRFRNAPGRGDLNWMIPVLAVAGLVVASYLAFVEVGDTEAVCGPVGDCNTVQQSSYARLFGMIPVGVVGVAGYLIVIGAWVVNRVARRPIADWAAVALAAGAVAGTLLSAYLTFLEPFVIGATCMWCITSALIITLLMWISVDPARHALRRLRTVA